MQKSRYVQIPNAITVHLGDKDIAASNMTISFVEYIKGCACLLVSPFWPENAQRANICAITSFALHRISCKWYRTRGYNFDITGSAEDDFPFDPKGVLFYNISLLVEEMFNNYLTRQGSGEPLPARICQYGPGAADGGILCQPEAVALAEKGGSVYDILRQCYGEDIVMVENVPRQGEQEHFLGTPLMRGASGNDICTIKRQLNCIGQNYPAIIPLDIDSPDFDAPCERAVRAFQYIFDLPVTGVLDKATWYSIKRTCAAIEKSGTSFPQNAVPKVASVLGHTLPDSTAQDSPIPDSDIQEDAVQLHTASERADSSIVVPGRVIPGNTLPRVIIPGDTTLDSAISDSGIAAKAQRESAPLGHTAWENAARWNLMQQNNMQNNATPSSITPESVIADRGIAARAELEGAMPDNVARAETPQARAARWNAARLNMPQEAGVPESPVLEPTSPTEHLVKIGPSVSTALPDEGAGVSSSHAVEWLRKFYGL